MSDLGVCLNPRAANLAHQVASLNARSPDLNGQVGKLSELGAELNRRRAEVNGVGRLNDRRRVNVLFAHRRSVYFELPVAVWDERRDAFRWDARDGGPVIAHPPCTLWSKMRGFARRPESERKCAWFALAAVRAKGGVLEHPAQSDFWHAASLPLPGKWDRWGFCIGVEQARWGHRASKPTWLYVSGVLPSEVPEIPRAVPVPALRVLDLGPDERDLTPRAFAWWLEEVASRARSWGAA